MDPASWVVWTSLALGAASGHEGSAAMGSAGAYRPVASWVAVEGQAGAGGIASSRDPSGGTSLSHFAVGTRLGPQRTSVRPFLWLALSHAHETELADIRRDPSGTLFGESAAGVHHRGGVEAGAGVSFAIPQARGRLGQHLVMDVRMTTLYLAHTHEEHDRTYGYGEVAVGYRF